MSRREASKELVTSKSVQALKFLANNSPRELLRMVFTYLKPVEAAAFRWAGRNAAKIGLEYLVPTVYVRLNEESYDRLLAIAEHPLVSKYVTKLEYETTGLKPLDCEEFYRLMLARAEAISLIEIYSARDSFASEQAWRAHKRDTIQNLPLLHKQRWDQAWLIYDKIQASQKKIQQAKFFHETLANAMKRFPKLVAISTPMTSVYERYAAVAIDSRPFHQIQDGEVFDFPLISSATSSVLLAAESAGLTIGSLNCQQFNWQIFSSSKKELTALKRSVSHLKNMNICFADPTCMNPYCIHEAVALIRRYLDKGRVMDFITSAPNLESLELSTDNYPRHADLPMVKAIIGKFHWPFLKAVYLAKLGSYEADLVKFCKRHKHTLKNLSLANLTLYKGSWATTFHGIRRTFRFGHQLDLCKFSGQFESQKDYYMMESIMVSRGRSPIRTNGVIASDYIRATNFGDITFNEYCQAMGYRD